MAGCGSKRKQEKKTNRASSEDWENRVLLPWSVGYQGQNDLDCNCLHPFLSFVTVVTRPLHCRGWRRVGASLTVAPGRSQCQLDKLPSALCPSPYCFFGGGRRCGRMLRGHFLAVLGRNMVQGTEPLTFYGTAQAPALGPSTSCSFLLASGAEFKATPQDHPPTSLGSPSAQDCTILDLPHGPPCLLLPRASGDFPSIRSSQRLCRYPGGGGLALGWAPGLPPITQHNGT